MKNPQKNKLTNQKMTTLVSRYSFFSIEHNDVVWSCFMPKEKVSLGDQVFLRMYDEEIAGKIPCTIKKILKFDIPAYKEKLNIIVGK